MKKTIIIIFVMFLIASCRTAPVKTEINNNDKIENASKIAIILRTPQNSVITREELYTSINSWLYGYFKEKEIIFIPDFREDIVEYTSQEESFYQLTPEDDFLQHKSVGVLNRFAAENLTDIEKCLSDSSSDLLLIFEVNAVFSEILQNMSYKTAIAVIGISNETAEVIHFDHQNQYAEAARPGYGEIKPDLLNRISRRLADFLTDKKFIRKI